MKKLIILLVSILLVSCTGNPSKEVELSDEQKQHYTEMAINVVDLFDKEEAITILDISSDDLKSAIDEEKLHTIFAQIKNNGNFVKILGSESMGLSDKGNTYFIVVLKAKYTKKDLTYTITFDETEKLAGIYYK